MSLILDALNKADHERKKDADKPTLGDIYVRASQAEKPFKKSTIAYLLGISIAFILVSLIIALNEKPDSLMRKLGEENIVQAHPTDPSVVPLRLKDNQKKPDSKTRSKHERLKKKLIATQYEKAAQETKKHSNTSHKIVEGAKPNLREKEMIAALYKAREPKEKRELKEIERVREERKLKTQEKNKISSLIKQEAVPPSTGEEKLYMSGYPNLVGVRSLPHKVQAEIPSLIYSAHNYLESGASVTLNKTLLHVGDQVSPELYIDKILADGVVLRYKSLKFKLRALTSWINL